MAEVVVPGVAAAQGRAARRVGWLAAAVFASGIAVAALTGWFVDRSPIVLQPTSATVFRSVWVAALVAVGSFSLWRRPRSRLGPLLAGLGFLFALTALDASGDAAAYTVGLLVLTVTYVFGVFVILCFPRGRLGSSFERRFILGFGAASAVAWVLVLVFAERLPHGGVFADCGSRCPANAFQLVTTSGGVGHALDSVVTGIAVIGFIGTAALVVAKVRTRTLLPRRALEPLSVILAAAVGVLVLSFLIAPSYPQTTEWFRVAVGVMLMGVPFAFWLGQVRGQLFAATAAGQFASAVSGADATPHRVQALVQEALGDPTLTLALASPVVGGFKTIDGDPYALPADGEQRAVTRIARDGRTAAALVHDASLDTDPKVVQGVAATALMLLENAQLVDELKASRARIVTAAEDERLRLERDLHDGAQQRLMAIQVKLGLLHDRLTAPDLVAEVDEITGDADAAVEELRRLAHGIYPAVLRERGLGDGLRALARTATLPVEVIVDHDLGRCEPTVEAAIYFCVAEAIQNATKHAGPDARVTIAVARSNRNVTFEVVDDGRGFDTAERTEGLGLVHLQDRIGAIGGELSVRSVPRRGSTVSGFAPVHEPVSGS